MFTFRVFLFISLSALFPVIFAENGQGNGTTTEPFVLSDGMALDILRNGIAEQELRSSSENGSTNGTNTFPSTVSDDIEGIAKTLIDLFVRSVNAMVRFFGNVLAKVTRSLDDPVPRKQANGTITKTKKVVMNGTHDAANSVLLEREKGANETSAKSENGTAKGHPAKVEAD